MMRAQLGLKFSVVTEIKTLGYMRLPVLVD